MTRPALSVVVCTYNRGHRVGRVLSALAAQTISERLDVVVVDDGSEVAPVLGDYGDARLVSHPINRGLAAARNTGVQHARAEVVAFTDDDCVPAPDWAERLLGAYHDPNVVGAGGAIAPRACDTFLRRYYAANNPLAPHEVELGASHALAYRLWLYVKGNVTPPRPIGQRPVCSLVGANFSFRRSTLSAVGGFDPAIRFGGEDEDICFRIRRALPQATLLFVPDAIIEHDYEPAFQDALRRARAYGRGNARNCVKHDDWGPTIYPVPLAVLALLALIGRWPRLALIGAALPLVCAPRWAAEAWRRRSPEPLAFAYVQLCQEASSDAGFLPAWRQYRRELAVS